ncbi:helix-turn-helix and ligand-binding sensor domain-containing protein [Aquimarina rubra]|uniref:LuxR C-terminal-related transcriptional regulator n=1 Tax=Aquimarina rubra TaxID=1920033 RepID=A0ABW5LPE7_9FLAO
MKYYIVSLLFTCINISAYCQIFYPEIENYTIENYKADNQNWGIDVDEQGVVYVANNRGLLRYNGHLWDLYPLPNKTIVRSVYCDNDRIYTGSYEEFGYWSKDTLGLYQYTSLINLLSPDHTLVNEDFWEIIQHNNSIYFRSFGGVYEYDGEQIRFIDGSQGVVDIEIFQDKILISIRNSGLYELKEGVLKPFQSDTSNLRLQIITSLAATKEMLFLYDEGEGGFILKNNKVISLSPQINSLLKATILNKALFINENEIAFGTIKKGVIVYNLSSQKAYTLEKSSGLHNNTVLGLKFDQGHLWVSLDNGITNINFENSLSYYTDITGTLGTVYDVVFFKGFYYLASNTGVYKLSEAGNLELIKGSEGQVWDLFTVKDHLLAGHNNGIYRIENDSIFPIDLSNGGVFEITPIDGRNEEYLLGTYSGILKLSYKDGEWQTQLVENIMFPVQKIIQESDGIIWASHPYKGIYRIILNKDHTRAIDKKDYGTHEKFKQYTTEPFHIGNQVLFQNSGRWFSYFKEGDSIGEYLGYSKLLGKDLVGRDNGHYWLIDKNMGEKIVFTDTDFTTIFQLKTSELQNRLVSGYEKVNVLNDSLRVLNLNDGMVLMNLRLLAKSLDKEIVYPPIVDKIIIPKGYQELQENFILPFNDSRNITFEVYAPYSIEREISYKLSGRLAQEGVLENGKVILQNLPYGDYQLDFRNKNATTTVQFNISPPWYLSIYLKLVYTLIFLLIIFLIYRRNKIKIRKQQIAMQRAYIKQTQERIAKIEKENLEREVLDKKRELTSSTASVIKKNEMIIELRNELNRLKELSPNQYRTKRLLSVSKNYLGDDNDWKIFQSSFNDLHKDFFKKLLESYPKLTTKDLKLCAYIKTGLTTKEIAPLMGITVRGVELHRYRLRKKLELATDDNFHNFLTLF